MNTEEAIEKIEGFKKELLSEFRRYKKLSDANDDVDEFYEGMMHGIIRAREIYEKHFEWPKNMFPVVVE